jgi:hypothetical protein
VHKAIAAVVVLFLYILVLVVLESALHLGRILLVVLGHLIEY